MQKVHPIHSSLERSSSSNRTSRRQLIRPQFLDDPENTYAKSEEPEYETDHQDSTERFLFVADLRIIRTARRNGCAAGDDDVLVVAGPTVVVARVES
jgi:hypothetical protein